MPTKTISLTKITVLCILLAKATNSTFSPLPRVQRTAHGDNALATKQTSHVVTDKNRAVVLRTAEVKLTTDRVRKKRQIEIHEKHGNPFVDDGNLSLKDKIKSNRKINQNISGSLNLDSKEDKTSTAHVHIYTGIYTTVCVSLDLLLRVLKLIFCVSFFK